MKKITLYFILTLAFSQALTSCCRYKMAKCSDGNPVSFPKSQKCAEKYYKDAVKTFEVNLKATVDVLEKVNVGVQDLSVKNDVKLLKDKLDNESIRFQESIKGSFLALQSNPCKNADNHYKLLQSLNDKNYELQQMKLEFQQSTNDSQTKNVTNEYLRGKKDGRNMGILSKKLEEYYEKNKKFPKDLKDLNIDEVLKNIGEGRLEYSFKDDNSITLRFAGADYVLNNTDDKLYEGKDGKINPKN